MPENPPVREQIRSPYFWLSMPVGGVVVLVWLIASAGWLHALALGLYLAASLVGTAASRDASRRRSRRSGGRAC